MGADHLALSEKRLLIASISRLNRVKVEQALASHFGEVHEVSSLDMLEEALNQFQPDLLVVSYRFSGLPDMAFFDFVDALPSERRPKLILMGTAQELEQEIRVGSLDGLLPIPFLPEMALLRAYTALDPLRSWREEREGVLNKMRKFYRFQVENLAVYFIRPFQERTLAIDISYQGLKVRSEKFKGYEQGVSVQMQLNAEGTTLVLGGQFVWYREGMAGLRFLAPKPLSFDAFFRKVIVKAHKVN